MSHLFMDASALVKRYVSEMGTGWVVSVTDPTAGNRVHVARVAGAEVVAAIARRARSGSLLAPDASVAIVRFRYDLLHVYRIVDVNRQVVERAMDLADGHGLRGYDSIQLAAALLLNDRRVARGWRPLTLVSSDLELNASAAAEGLLVDDPNTHP